MKQEELDNIIKFHNKWLKDEEGGEKANLRDAELEYAKLKYAKLEYADLGRAKLYDTDLSCADLEYAKLEYADLGRAKLYDTDLSCADLEYANVCGADLRGANLRGADLSCADLEYANLCGANLRGANLKYADLNWVNWHEVQGLKVYVAGLQSSRENAQLAYIPSLDVATTGCWQDTWKATKKRVASVYDKDDPIYKKYQLAFKYIEAQMKLDNL